MTSIHLFLEYYFSINLTVKKASVYLSKNLEDLVKLISNMFYFVLNRPIFNSLIIFKARNFPMTGIVF